MKTKPFPTTCGECMFYNLSPYRCHMEQGVESKCALGYMRGDMRDVNLEHAKYSGCKLSEAKHNAIMAAISAKEAKL